MPLLNEAKIRSARPQERAYKLFDERGLFMLVTPTGGRLWRFRYRLGGVEKLLTLGAYPDVTLKRAREKRDDARKLVADGLIRARSGRLSERLRPTLSRQSQASGWSFKASRSRRRRSRSWGHGLRAFCIRMSGVVPSHPLLLRNS